MAKKDKTKRDPAPADAAAVKATGWSEDRARTAWREFPVPGAAERLRVHFAAEAYAELICHAKEDLASEVCGVLAGELCEDSAGLWVAVRAVVRGTSTQAGASHVTYTQETWNQIHETMEREHPKLHIVGWYHSHPGFGVAFSDMDLFIHQNFFAGRGQVAFVTDPLGGEEAICVTGRSGTEHLERFWVDRRERRLASPAERPEASGAPARADAPDRALAAVEDRLSQALVAIEDLRASYHRFLAAVGVLVAVGVAMWIGDMIYTRLAAPARPPEVQAFAPGPVKINGRWRYVGAQLTVVPLDPKLEQRLLGAELEALAAALAEQAAAEAAAEAAATEPAATQPAAQEAQP